MTAIARARDRITACVDGRTLLRVPAGGHRCGGLGREHARTLPPSTSPSGRSPTPTTSASARRPATLGRAGTARASRRLEAPVVGVSFDDALDYATWAGLRLPREHEWEVAAGLGWDPDASLAAVAWFRENSDGHPRPVARLCPTGPGFHDLLGNVFEWTTDWYDATRTYRVVRGGSWKSVAADVHPAHRDFNPPVDRMNCIGFRCAWTPAAADAEAA